MLLACSGESMLMELRYTDLEERYRTRLLYASTPEERSQCEAELASASQVRQTWLALMEEADAVDWSLEETKKNFSEITREQVRPGPRAPDHSLLGRCCYLGAKHERV